MNRRRSLY